MNNNFKNFLKEKKDLLIFLGVLIVTFISVITLTTIAGNDNDKDVGGGNGSIVVPPGDDLEPTTPEPQPEHKFQLPIKEKYVISREFFDLTSDPSILANSVISNGKTYVESRGISFKKEDNKVFDVYNVFPGEVVGVSGNAESLEGFTITIKHDNDLTSTYSSLSSVNVNVGDILTETSKIGVSGTTVKDLEAGIHVHLTLMHKTDYINPKNAIDKEISELASVVK